MQNANYVMTHATLVKFYHRAWMMSIQSLTKIKLDIIVSKKMKIVYELQCGHFAMKIKEVALKQLH